MKSYAHISVILAILTSSIAGAEAIKIEFADVDNLTDFSISGMSEKKTLGIFQAELEDEAEDLTNRYLSQGETLEMTITDFDMAGDIQPWRNRYNADIRYIEPVYPPRIEFTYVLRDAEGNVLSEGQESISDLAYQTGSVTSWRARSMSFFYEFELIKSWLRNLMVELRSGEIGG